MWFVPLKLSLIKFNSFLFTKKFKYLRSIAMLYSFEKHENRLYFIISVTNVSFILKTGV